MANNKKRKNKRRNEAERLQLRYDALMTGLALFVLTVAPLFFRMVRLDFVSPVITNTTTADTGVMNDVFTHYKMIIYYALAVLLIIIFAARLLTSEDDGGDFRLTRYDAALGALCALLLLSCIVSEYRIVAFNGFIYMLDGTVEHICYCILFFFGFHVFSKSRFKEWFYVPLFVCGVINALIALLNFCGVSMIDTAIIKTVLGVPANAVATNARAFLSTFGNANYLSGFGGVLFAVFFTRLMFSESSFRPAGKSASGKPASGKGIFARADGLSLFQNVLSFLMVAVSFSIIVTSLSSSGFLTFVVMAPVILVFSALRGINGRKLALAVGSLAVCALILISLSSIDKTVFDETFGMFNMIAYGSSGADAVENAAGARLAAESAGVPPAPQEAPQLTLLLTETPLPPGAPQLTLLSLETPPPPDTPQLTLLSSEAPAPPPVAPLLTLLSSESQPPPTAPRQPAASADSFDFDLPEVFPEPGISAGTGRLYIWKETFRLIARKPFTGYGMDTLSYAFPQNRLDKVAGLGSYSIFVTKPHNAYIGYAYGAGVPALLVFLALNVFGAAAFLRYFFSRKTAGEAPGTLILCAFMGWAAYLVQAFVNDDLISTAPLWWTLFGIGAGLIREAGREAGRQPEKLIG